MRTFTKCVGALWVVAGLGVAGASHAGDLIVDGNLTVTTNLTVQGQLMGNGASVSNVDASMLGGKTSGAFLGTNTTAAQIGALSTNGGVLGGVLFRAGSTNCFLRPDGNTNTIIVRTNSIMEIWAGTNLALCVQTNGSVGVRCSPTLSTDDLRVTGGSGRITAVSLQSSIWSPTAYSSTANGSIRLNTNTSLIVRYGTNDMHLLSALGFGIGTTNPTERLHVVGNAKVTGSVTAQSLSVMGQTVVNSNGVVVGPVCSTNVTIQGPLVLTNTLTVSGSLVAQGGLVITNGTVVLSGAVVTGLAASSVSGLGSAALSNANAFAPAAFYAVTAADTAVGNGANGSGDGTALGSGAVGSNSGAGVGANADGHSYGVAMGCWADGSHDGTALGYSADGYRSGAAIGDGANGSYEGAAIGYGAGGQDSGVAVGAYAHGHGLGNLALGGGDGVDPAATVPDGWTDTVELGRGTASLQGGLNFRGYGLVDSNGMLAATIPYYGVTDLDTAVGNGADGSSHGVAMGEGANGSNGGTAVGAGTDGSLGGTALGSTAAGFGWGTAIGNGAKGTNFGTAAGFFADGSSVGAAMGESANAVNFGAAVGTGAHGFGTGAALGFQADGSLYGAAVGCFANGSLNGAAMGEGADAADFGVAIGTGANGTSRGAALGFAAKGSSNGVAVGYLSVAVGAGRFAIGGLEGELASNACPAVADADGAGQLGPGSNTNVRSLQFREWPLVMDGGNIPVERLTNALVTASTVNIVSGRFSTVLSGELRGTNDVEGPLVINLQTGTITQNDNDELIDLKNRRLRGQWYVEEQGDLTMGEWQ